MRAADGGQLKGGRATQGYFASHCPHCHAPLEDIYLHSEPDEPSFDILTVREKVRSTD